MVEATHKASKCIHHWIVGDFIHDDGEGDYNYEPGECKKCGATKRFRSRGRLGPSGTGHWGVQNDGWDEDKYDKYKKAVSSQARDRRGHFVGTDSQGRRRRKLDGAGRRVRYALNGIPRVIPERNP